MLGTVLLKAGENQEALAAFKSALPGLLEKIRSGDSDQQRFAAQSFRIGEFINAYISLLTSTPTADLNLAEGLDPVAYAFELAQLAEQGVVQRSLLASSARAAARDPELADLVRRVQDLKYQIDALTGAVANQYSLDAETQDKALIAQMKEQIDELRPARTALVSAIDTQFPLYAQLINPAPLPVEGLRALLRPKEVSIVTHVASDRVHIWVVPYSGELTYASAPFDQQELASTVALLRRALDPKVSTLGEIPVFDLGEAYRLYEALLKPIEAAWQDAESLLVVVDGALGQLPLSLLPTEPVKLGQDKEVLFETYRGIPWLARTHAVTVLPSVVSLAALRSLPTPSEGRRAFVGFGDPVFSATQLAEATSDNEPQTVVLDSRGPLATRGLPIKLRALPEMEGVDSADLARLPRLPDTADEVRSIALALNADFTRDVFLGKAANEKTVKTLDLSAYKVLAFATHGLVPGDLNGLTQPALALTAPQVAGVEGDGLLTLGEILGLKLDADWVVLSACNTAAADGAGAEAISGLGRAFFYAGARSLLVSNWPVETTSAKMLTTDVFRRQAQDLSLSRAEALRQAMVALIDGPGYVDGEGRTVFSYAHPIFWAPFTLAGDGGGGGPGS